MGKPKAPKPPDPIKQGSAQTATNIGTAVANAFLQNPTQVTPTGTYRFGKTGNMRWKDPVSGKTYNIPQFTATTRLTPRAQRIENSRLATQQNIANLGRDQSARIGDILSEPFDASSVPDAPDASMLDADMPDPRMLNGLGGPQRYVRPDRGDEITQTYGTNFSRDRRRVERALFDRLNEDIDRDREALETRLANQGLTYGSEARSRALEDFGENVNDARLSAILGAGQEQSRLVGLEAQRAAFENAAQQQGYGQRLASGQFANQAQQQAFNQRLARYGAQSDAGQREFNQNLARFNAETGNRQQALQEGFALRNQPINEITALLSGSQVAMPQFQTARPSVPTTDYAGLMNQRYQNELGAYGQQMGQYNNIMGGLFGLGSAGIIGFGGAR